MKRLFPKKVPVVRRGHLGDVRFHRAPPLQNIVLLYFFMFGIGLTVLVLSLRLFQLTIVKGAYYRRLSEENRVKEITIDPKRGSIIDRKGFVIAENKEADVSSGHERISSRRLYEAGEETAHLIGYRQLADRADIKNDNCVNRLKLGDKVGKKGVEQLFDCELRGVAGKKLVEVDAVGEYLRTLTVVPPQNGATIQLAIDLDLQKTAYEAIKGKKAAVVGLVPKTGEVLVFTSSPSFDPQAFEDGGGQVEDYLADTDHPLFNRLTEGTYPPGSIFKLFVSAGILEDKKMTEDTIVMDTGNIKAGPITFGKWYFLQYGKTEGPVNLIKALQRSNDIYFYKAGEALGPEGIKKWAGRFGLNGGTDIGMNETEGTIPSPFWKEETLHEKWYLGDTYNMSIGQGYTLLAPIQLAQGVLPFANGGNLCSPVLLKNGKTNCRKVAMSQKTLALIREGMRQACATGGTGWPLFDFAVAASPEAALAGGKTASPSALPKKSIPVGCKTGTAESHAKSGMPHAWFTAFAPFEEPEIMLTILVEEGGQGSDVAAPIARDIFKAYFERIQ